MEKERKGIAIAGSIILDQVKKVELYPPRLMLTSIKELSRAVDSISGMKSRAEIEALVASMPKRQ